MLTVVLVLDVGVLEGAVRGRMHGLEGDEGEDDGPRVGSVQGGPTGFNAGNGIIPYAV